MMLLALTLSFAAFAALSLAMEKHQQDLHGKAAAAPARRTQWRVLGWALLVIAFLMTALMRVTNKEPDQPVAASAH